MNHFAQNVHFVIWTAHINVKYWDRQQCCNSGVFGSKNTTLNRQYNPAFIELIDWSLRQLLTQSVDYYEVACLCHEYSALDGRKNYADALGKCGADISSSEMGEWYLNVLCCSGRKVIYLGQKQHSRNHQCFQQNVSFCLMKCDFGVSLACLLASQKTESALC